MNMLADMPAAKIRILALHGRGSNGGVTRLQLRNLGISEAEYDVLYVDGPISSDRPGPGIAELEELVPGPGIRGFPTMMGYGRTVGRCVMQYAMPSSMYFRFCRTTARLMRCSASAKGD